MQCLFVSLLLAFILFRIEEFIHFYEEAFMRKRRLLYRSDAQEEAFMHKRRVPTLPKIFVTFSPVSGSTTSPPFKKKTNPYICLGIYRDLFLLAIITFQNRSFLPPKTQVHITKI